MFRRLLAKTNFSSGFYREPLELATVRNPSFKRRDLLITKTTHPRTVPPTTVKDLVFGDKETDHMLEIEWNSITGWDKPKISPFEHFEVHPFSSALHYGIQCYQGLKAYKDESGTITLFRPECNMRRFKVSSESLCMPDFDGKELLECIKELVRLDEQWIPTTRGFGLYIRPFHISTEPTLGVKEARSTKIATVLNPVGPYYASGFEPIRLLIESNSIRSAPGGYGFYKIGGNYGPTIAASKQAKKKGYHQCLYLFRDEVIEVGTSNIFFVIKGKDGTKELITPSLDSGMILPGITRDSVIELTKLKKDYRVVERTITIQEVIEAIEEKRMLEIFATGTAVVISPVKELGYNGRDYPVPINPVKKAGDLASELFDEMLNIQTGKVDHPWCVRIN